MKKRMCKSVKLPIIIAFCLFTVGGAGVSSGAMNGTCNDCHTMHNSQDGATMNIDGTTTTALPQLLRGDCYGCHASNTASAIYTLGTDAIPQVLHSGAVDLAGGSFSYVTAAASSNGHNITDLTGAEGVLTSIPGVTSNAHNLKIMPAGVSALTCDGATGCHGYRSAFAQPATGEDGVTGAHHSNVDGQLTVASNPGNSYRFLMGVKGYEDPDWEFTVGPGDHNEYLGLASPLLVSPIPAADCSNAALGGCHSVSGIQAPSGTISQFCGTCHDNFHSLTANINGDDTDNEYGIGYAASSPFIRHPTDVTMPATAEFAAYVGYDNRSPVARQTVPAGPLATVTTGAAGDVVMCLSCHRAHGTQYPDMLRWDYTTMIANQGAGNTDGCFVCHRTKN